MMNVNSEYIYYTLMLLLLISSIAILFSRSFLLVIPLLSIFSLLICLIYLFLRAEDVAITEVAVGSCVSTIILLGAYLRLKPQEEILKLTMRKVSAYVIIFSFAIVLVRYLPEFANIKNLADNYAYTYYLENTIKEIGINSTVSAILASYRGFDTLGETIVIMLAGVGVISLSDKS